MASEVLREILHESPPPPPPALITNAVAQKTLNRGLIQKWPFSGGLIQKWALHKILYAALAVVNVGELRAAKDDVALVAYDIRPCVSCCTHWQHVELWAHASQIHAVIHWVGPAACAILLRIQQREPEHVREREREMERQRDRARESPREMARQRGAEGER